MIKADLMIIMRIFNDDVNLIMSYLIIDPVYVFPFNDDGKI